MEERDLIIGIHIRDDVFQISCQRGLIEGMSIENEEIPKDIKEEEDVTTKAVLFAAKIKQVLKEQGLEGFEKELRLLVFTAKDIGGKTGEFLKALKDGPFSALPDVRIIKEKEALFHYVINQPRELKGFEVLVIDMIDDELIINRAITEKGRRPLPVLIEDEDNEGLSRPNDAMTGEQKDRALSILDAELSALCENILKTHIVTGIYLLGEVFEAGWYTLTRDVLCRNRRVFVGSNLYSRGACLYASDSLYEKEKADSYLFISEDILKHNIGVKIRKNGSEVTEFVIEGGRPYRDATASFTFIPDHDLSLPIVIRPIRGDITDRVVPLPIPKEKDREPGSMRFKCNLSLESDHELLVIVEDVGMGELYPSTGKRYKEVITL